MPLSVRMFLVIFLFVVFLAFIVVPLLRNFRRIYLWPMQNRPIEPGQKELLGAVFGILAVDLFLYFVYRSTLPKSFFYGTLASLNLLCLSFVSYDYLAWWLYQKVSVSSVSVPPNGSRKDRASAASEENSTIGKAKRSSGDVVGKIQSVLPDREVVADVQVSHLP